jgi:integrase
MTQSNASNPQTRRRSNPKNDRLKRDYLIYLRNALGRSGQTADQVRHAIDRLEDYTTFKDFSTFNREQALGFKTALMETKSQRTGNPISIATVRSILYAVKEFIAWLSINRQMPRKFRAQDIDYLGLTVGDERRARVVTPKPYPTCEQHRQAVCAMPSSTEIELRDRAVMAALLLTGMRDDALVGLRISDVKLGANYIFQNPQHLRIKFRKSIDTFFFPVGDDVQKIFADWVSFLIDVKEFGPHDPVFPKTDVAPNDQQVFAATGLAREPWANAAPVRKIYRAAFARIGLEFTRPHAVRDTLTQLGYALKLNPEEMKSWSQNLGHDRVLTTLTSYGQVTRERQGELIAKLGNRQSPGHVEDMTMDQLYEALGKKLKTQSS